MRTRRPELEPERRRGGGRLLGRSPALAARREAAARPAQHSTIYDWTTTLTAPLTQVRAFDAALGELHDGVALGNHQMWGDPLPEHVLAQLGVALGADFAGVTLSKGPEAQRLGAEAFTRGEHIVFAPGALAPGTQRGRELIGHELVHVMQQRAGRTPGDGLVRDAALEAEADRLGARAARGEAVHVGWARDRAADASATQLKAAAPEWQDNTLERLVKTEVRDGPAGPHGPRRELRLQVEHMSADGQADSLYSVVYVEGFALALVQPPGAVISAKGLNEKNYAEVGRFLARMHALREAHPELWSQADIEAATKKAMTAVAECARIIYSTSNGGPLPRAQDEIDYYQRGQKTTKEDARKDPPAGEQTSVEGQGDDAGTGTPKPRPSHPPIERPPAPELPEVTPEEPEPKTPEITTTKTPARAVGPIRFATDEATLVPESRAALDALVAALGDNPQITRIRIEGHTDASGREKHNDALSQRRADAVRAYLDGKVGGVRLEAVGHGERRPIADNKTPAGRAQNRRVELVILDGDAP